MTRQRVRPEMDIKTAEPNPNINGEVEAPIVLMDKIKADLEKILANPKHKKKNDSKSIENAMRNRPLGGLKASWAVQARLNTFLGRLWDIFLAP